MYRVKIGNTEIPNSWISRGSYSISNNPRECERFTDATGIEHIIPFGKSKTTITFSVREHRATEHSQIASILANRFNLSVEYYDDNVGAYKEGNFHIKDFTWSHNNADPIVYNSTNITLEEY